MVEPLVLIIGQRPDPHIDVVEAQLKRIGCQPYVFDRWDPNQFATIQIGKGQEGWLVFQRRRISLDSFSAVWWRVKPTRPVEFSSPAGNLSEAFALREWRTLLRCLPFFTKRAFWINSLENHQRVQFKPWQLALAIEVGLEVPVTAITNSSEDVITLLGDTNEIVYKTLNAFISPPDEIIFTNVVTLSKIRDSHMEIASAPGIFQNYLPKDHELRVTVIKNQITVVRIDSQTASATKHDWRRDQSRAMYHRGTLSQATQEKLLRFHERAGLVFAAYDFVVTRDGREVFLECNPGGQWLWLENCLGLDLTAQLAHVIKTGLLTSNSNEQAINRKAGVAKS